jgi:hypothetical protein
MKRAVYRSPTLQEPDKWHQWSDTVWECYMRYKPTRTSAGCTFSIRKHDESHGKYVPTCNGVFDFFIGDEPIPADRINKFDSFEEAANYCKRYIDWMNNVWFKKSLELDRKRLHTLRPDIYPA